MPDINAQKETHPTDKFNFRIATRTPTSPRLWWGKGKGIWAHAQAEQTSVHPCSSVTQTAKGQKQHTVGRWMDKQNAVHTHNGKPFSINKEILTHAMISMNLKDIMLREISPLQEDKYCMSLEVPTVVKFFKTESGAVVARS